MRFVTVLKLLLILGLVSFSKPVRGQVFALGTIPWTYGTQGARYRWGLTP